jgi:5-methylthioadenosine/S-adenosylhomocysteine deaminase
MPTLFSRHALLPGPGDATHVSAARVTVDGAWITAVEPADAPAEGDEDLGSDLLAPAFVDVHTHLALVALRGVDARVAARGNLVEDLYFRVEKHLQPGDVRALAAVGAQECLLAGTGFVSDHYYFASDVAEAMVDMGLTGLVAPTLQDLAGPGKDGWEAAIAETGDLHESARLRAAGVTSILGPHATDTVSDALWRRIAERADAWQLPVHSHLAQSAAEVRRAYDRVGDTPLGLLRRLGVLDAGPAWALVHALYTTPADRASLDPARHLFVACPSSQMWFGFPAPVARWQADGVRWAVATDCAASNDSMAVNKELRAIALLRAAATTTCGPLAAWEASSGAPDAVEAARTSDRTAWTEPDHAAALLARVTSVPGALHPKHRAGVIAPGALANLTVWDTDHPAMWPGHDPHRALATGDVSGALVRMMTRGAWLSARGEHAALAQSEAWRSARAEARDKLEALLTRAGV